MRCPRSASPRNARQSSLAMRPPTVCISQKRSPRLLGYMSLTVCSPETLAKVPWQCARLLSASPRNARQSFLAICRSQFALQKRSPKYLWRVLAWGMLFPNHFIGRPPVPPPPPAPLAGHTPPSPGPWLCAKCRLCATTISVKLLSSETKLLNSRVM